MAVALAYGSTVALAGLEACVPAAPAPADLPATLATLLSDAAPPSDTSPAPDGEPVDASADGPRVEAPRDSAPEASREVEAYFCPGSPSAAAGAAVGKEAAGDAAPPRARSSKSVARSAPPYAAADAQSAFTAPLRLFAEPNYAGVEISLASSVLDLSAFPDTEGRCRRFASPVRSYHLEVGYSAAFYAQRDYLAECARVGPDIGHDIGDLMTMCPQIASIRVVKGSLDSGVEQPARQ